KRDHYFWQDLYSLLSHAGGCFEDGSSLHLGYLGKDYAETAASVSEHWICFAKRLDPGPKRRSLDLEFLCQLSSLLFGVRKKLVKRGVECANGDRKPVHRLEDSFEVVALQLEQFSEASLIQPLRLLYLFLQRAPRSSKLLAPLC